MRRYSLACSIDGCKNASRKRGWCSMHYRRWFRHGNPDTVKLKGWFSRSPEDKARKSALTTGRRHAPEIRAKISAANKGKAGLRAETNGRWIGDNITYHGLHKRLESQREKPSNCEHCHRADKKLSWAWNHDSPVESTRLDTHGRSYSIDLCDYIALCYSCHQRYDSSFIAKRSSIKLWAYFQI